MEERFDRLETMIGELGGQLRSTEEKLGRRIDGVEQKVDATAAKLDAVAEVGRATATRVDSLSHQLAGVSKRIDGLTRHQKQFATDMTKRLKRAEAKAQITIEGHEATRSEMRKAFAQLRWDINNRVQPIETAVRNRK